MRRTRVIAAVLCAGLLVPTAAVAAPTPDTVAESSVSQAGQVVSAKLIQRMSKQEVTTYLADYELAGQVRNGVDLYLVTYRTVDGHGRPTKASTLVVMPRTDKRTLRPVAWLHGTRVFREDTATLSDNLDRGAAVLFAASGHLTVAPDYLGLGTGTGPHPYMLARPTVTATLDALRASREFAARNGKRLTREVLVSGFSQGGQASMLVGEELARRGELSAIAAIAGPFDIRGQELPAALDGRLDGVSAVIYLGYAMTAWNRYYSLYSSPSEAFRAPYDQVVEDLFDGSHEEGEVVAALPDSPEKLFTDEFLARLANPTGALARVLEENDNPCAWHPTVPVHLYAGTQDRDVVFENSVSCRASLKKATVVNVGPVDHFTSARQALPQIATWFADR